MDWQTFENADFFGRAVSSVSGVKGGLRLPTVGSRLSAPISPIIREIQSELQAAFSQQAWAGKTFSSVGLGWQVSSWGPQTLSSGVQDGCKFPAGKGARRWGCQLGGPTCESFMARRPSIFPRRRSAKSIFRWQTEKIYFQNTTLKLIFFVLFTAEFCFYQGQTNFAAKIYIISAEDNMREIVCCFFID